MRGNCTATCTACMSLTLVQPQMVVTEALNSQCWLEKTTRGLSETPQLKFIGRMLALLHFMSLNIHEVKSVSAIMILI